VSDEHEWGWRRWRVALIAHDAKQADLVAFIRRYRKAFADWSLVATEATAAMFRQEPGPRGRECYTAV